MDYYMPEKQFILLIRTLIAKNYSTEPTLLSDISRFLRKLISQLLHSLNPSQCTRGPAISTATNYLRRTKSFHYKDPVRC